MLFHCKTILKNTLLIFFFIGVYFPKNGFAQQKTLYKKIDTTQLFLKKINPIDFDHSKKYPAMVFFFGGGWTKGSINQFKPHAEYFSKRGMVCFLVDYRVSSRHQSTPFESLKDAKSAIRFIRKNAQEFAVDTSKIIGAGGSAGGQLAAAAALIEKYNEETDDVSISSKPNALVLFNPAIDNGPEGVGFDRVKEDYQNFSPIHNIKKNAPPTIIFLGTKDDLIPVSTAKLYQSKMVENGNVCELHLYENAKHGFFNYNKFENYKSTVLKTNAFLISLGYLTKQPEIELK